MNSDLQSAFLAEASTLLILLAGAILLYRSFREKYLVPWIAGWTVSSLSKPFVVLTVTPAPSRLWTALAYASFVIAVGLFAGTVFLYTYQNKLLWPAGIVISVFLLMGVAFAFWLPGTALLRTVSNLSRLLLIVASVRLVRFTWGRANMGRWLLAAP